MFYYNASYPTGDNKRLITGFLFLLRMIPTYEVSTVGLPAARQFHNTLLKNAYWCLGHIENPPSPS